MTIRTPRPHPTVAAVLLPAERQKVEAACNGCFTIMHRDSVPEAVRAVRERSVDALLHSVHRCEPSETDSIRQILTSFPGLPAVALVSRPDPSASEVH